MTDSNVPAIPMKLIPAGKDYLWGGTRLREEFGKDVCSGPRSAPLAETWECSTHPDGTSLVILPRGSGCGDNTISLRSLLTGHPEYMGSHPHRSMPEAAGRGEIPILIKFIDAASDLSIQVHPDDAYARKRENGQLGKTEMWYVLDAAKDASLICGFSRDIDRATLLRALRTDRLSDYLQRVPVHRDDVFFIPAGTVHAVGAGSLILEVQESSNLTYRLYDYHRRGPDGKERELHVEKALEVADLRGGASLRQPMRVLRYRPGYASELLCRCRYFQVRRLLIRTRQEMPPVVYSTDLTSFHVIICTEGKGVLTYEDVSMNGSLCFSRGDSVFIPAGAGPFGLRGSAVLLDVNC